MMNLIRFLLIFFMVVFFPLIKRYPWKLVFAINISTDADAKAFVPLWLSKKLKRFGFIPGGVIKTPFGMGLVVGSFYTNNEILSSHYICNELVASLSKYNGKFFGLNGVIPSATLAHGVFPENDPRFVKDDFGTVFMIVDNVNSILKEHPEIRALPIGVIGCGHLGRKLVRELEVELEGKNTIYGFDSKVKSFNTTKAFFFGDDYTKLEECGLNVLLTTNGDDGIDTIVNHLKSGSIVLSDTHPKVSNKKWRLLVKNGVIGYESAAAIEGFKFFPPFPKRDPTDLVGCIIQPLIAITTNSTPKTQDEFNDMVKQAGITGRLKVPLAPTHLTETLSEQRQIPISAQR